MLGLWVTHSTYRRSDERSGSVLLTFELPFCAVPVHVECRPYVRYRMLHNNDIMYRTSYSLLHIVSGFPSDNSGSISTVPDTVRYSYSTRCESDSHHFDYCTLHSINTVLYYSVNLSGEKNYGK